MGMWIQYNICSFCSPCTTMHKMCLTLAKPSMFTLASISRNTIFK